MNILNHEIIKKYWESWGDNPLICKPKGKLYHYTSAEAFNSILSKSELWITNSSFMNDKSEVNYACELFYERLDESKIKESLKGEIKALFKKAITEGLFNNSFILSTSTNSDSLPMWNYYGSTVGYIFELSNELVSDFGTQKYIYNISLDNECEDNGVALKKNKNLCTEIITSENEVGYNVRANNVIYDREIQGKILDDIIEYINKQDILSNDETYDNTQIATSKLIDFIPFFKHECYKNEEEYRMIIQILDTKMWDVQNYRIRNGALVPYIKLKFNKKNYIKKIGVSPFNNNEYTLLGIKSIIKNYPVEIELITSELPSRF